MHHSQGVLLAATSLLLSVGTAARSQEPPPKRPALTLRWPHLADTVRYSVRYVQLNFDVVPKATAAGNVLTALASRQYPARPLTHRQQWQLYRLATTPDFYSEGDCGTFHLNAGFVVYRGSRIVGTIDLGCGYNQWNYEPANPKAKYGFLNEQGFQAMQRLLDELNAPAKR